MLNKTTALLAITALLCSALAADDDATELLNDTAKQYDSLFKTDFTVNMKSQEIATLVENAVATKSAQAGIPLKIKIKHFILTAKEGAFSCKTALDVPDENMRQMMENQANQMLESTGFSKALADLTLGALAKAAALLTDNAESFTLTKDNPKGSIVTLENPDTTLFGKLPVTKVTMFVVKEYKIVNDMLFNFQDASAIRVQLAHNMVDERICPTRMLVNHTLNVKPAGITLPRKINVSFTDYSFK